MAVTKGHARKLVDRLCTLPGNQNEMFDSAVDAKTAVRGELLRALERNASSDRQATQIVDLLMEGKFRPVPSEIRDAAEKVPGKEPLPDGCDICGGEPWVMVERLVYEFPQAHPTLRGKQYMASGAARCTCAKGQYFRIKDRENTAKRAAGLPV